MSKTVRELRVGLGTAWGEAISGGGGAVTAQAAILNSQVNGGAVAETSSLAGYQVPSTRAR